MDKNKCTSCGEAPKCSCKNKEFTKAVIEINNPEETITLMRKVVIPASMGDDTTVPPTVGKYKNVLLYYEANSKSYLYSSDGIPTLLANGLTDYEQAVNLPQINGVELIGNKTLNDLGVKVYFFDAVSDMKASADLINGDYVKTYGYYAKNDEGGAFYKISSTAPSGYYETLNSGLYAELIIEDAMNVKQFGAKGDGISDDTTAIQTALDNCLNIDVPTGTYMINALTKINLNSNNRLRLDNDATIKAITNDATSYAVLWLEDVTNVEISGGTIEGDRLTHTGSTGEWGHCIRLLNACDEIYIHDINLINAWGDGLDVKTTGSVRTARVHVNNARRNGYSIAAVNKFTSTDDFIENTNGTAPECGVDVEPDDATQIPYNVVFNNLTTKNNNRSGISVHLGKANQTMANVRINNLRSDGDNRGFLADSTDLAYGEVTVVDPLITNSVSNGIYLQVDGNGVNYRIIRPVVTKYGVTSSSSSGIYLNNDVGDAGNVVITEPTVTLPVGETTTELAVNIAHGSSGVWKNVQIIDPLDFDGRYINFNNSGNANVKITDRFEVLVKDRDSNYNIGNQLFCTNTSYNYTANRKITILDTTSFPDKAEIRFINTGDYQMQVYFKNQYIYPLSTVADKTVTLGDKGASLVVRRNGSDSWTVLSQSGTITTN